jgi:hypothetical protein
MVNPKAFFLRQQALKAKLEPLAITKKKKKKKNSVVQPCK